MWISNRIIFTNLLWRSQNKILYSVCFYNQCAALDCRHPPGDRSNRVSSYLLLVSFFVLMVMTMMSSCNTRGWELLRKDSFRTYWDHLHFSIFLVLTFHLSDEYFQLQTLWTTKKHFSCIFSSFHSIKHVSYLVINDISWT